MNIKRLVTLILAFTLTYGLVYAQTFTQTINGKVLDAQTRKPLSFATVVVLDTDPVIGTSCDVNGNFTLEKVPVGRQSISISMVGYETYVVNEFLVSSGHNARIEAELSPKAQELDEVVVRVRKDEALNKMSTVSSRQFTVEETQRYAGGLNDPARLASSFAGVATPSVSSNGISVRGNSPNGLLWQIEGVEVPNPNHFANLTVTGGGLITAISNQMMGNSDFLTGAFPAEYGNATSGVFDIKLRKGNNKKRRHTVQAGLIGVDIATEGPFVEDGKSSYLMNYRNSTMALLSPILPDNTGILKYQDLAFKTHFPTQKAGTISFWGIGALDGQEMEAADSSEWSMNADRDNSKTGLYMYASGLSHHIRLGSQTFLKTKLAATGSGLWHEEKRVGFDDVERPQSDVDNNSWRFTFQSNLNHNFSKNHHNETGIQYSQMGYNINIVQSPDEGVAPIPMASQKGNSGLIRFYSQSRVNLGERFTLNAGVNTQLFLLNDNYAVEPRAGLTYQINPKQSIAMAYGLHSRIEDLKVYFVEEEEAYPNKSLDLMTSAHYVLGYNLKINDHLRLNIEPYYQRLTNVPVAPDSYISTVNFEEEIFFNEVLVNEGTGHNIGIDFTLEQFLHKGFYYLLTASIFDSKYTATDGIERNTRFNRNYVINALAGKEWKVGKNDNNLLSANVRLNYMGGNRKEPVNRAASMAAKEVIFEETTENRAYEEQFDDKPIVSFTISYRRNKPTHASIWSLQVVNALKTKEFDRHYYNLNTHGIDEQYKGIMVPEISYKIEF